MYKNNNKRSVFDPKNLVSISKTLKADDLSLLAQGKLCAIIIPDYYPEELCDAVANNLINHPEHGSYYSDGHAPDVANVGRVGVSYFEVSNNPELVKNYHAQAIEMTNKLRKIFEPYYSPIDRLRLDLQEIWPAGANLETLKGEKMFVGLCRTVEPNKEFLPHQDVFEWDAPGVIEARSLKGQIACNIYLHMDKEGGELELWAEDYTREEANAIRLANSYGMNKDRMKTPSCRIKPKIGDLVLFNSRRPHAVAASKSTYRMSVSCFIGYRGEHMPLTNWS